MIALTDLDVYKPGEQLSDMVWEDFDHWPEKAQRTIGYQIIRSSDSVSINIVEGYGRYTPADRRNFYRYSRGSFEETKGWLFKASKRRIIDELRMKEYHSVIDELGPKLNALHQLSIFKFPISTPPATSSFKGLLSSFPDISNFKFLFSILLSLVLLWSCEKPTDRLETDQAVVANRYTTDLMLSESQVKLANITTQLVSIKPVGQTLVLNARVAENEDLTEAISSRASGRIEKLFIKETGGVVSFGAPLYELYSETLLTLQREYLLAKQQYEMLGKEEPRYESFVSAAKRKLLLYGLTKKQVEKLEQTGTVQQRTTFVAPSGGIVSEIKVNEGQYIEEGSLLFRIVDINRLWLEAELYATESAWVKPGDKLTFRVNGFESTPLETEVIFMSPAYRANSQITVIRAAISNPEGKFKPGMQAQVLFTHSSRSAVAIPTDAVIRDAKGTRVYIETATNTFQPRLVKTGLEDFEQVEITEGLQEGDRIVVTGAYLLYSEMILKKGTDSMTGHNHQ